MSATEIIKSDPEVTYREDKKRSYRDKRRKILRKLAESIQDSDGVNSVDALFSRQIDDEDVFSADVYDKHRLVQPPYSFNRLYNVFEESDVLQECVDAMQQNIGGFGHKLLFLGKDKEERNTPEEQQKYEILKDFFDQVNEEQSFASVRKMQRADYEVLGNGGYEVIRNIKGGVTLLKQIPFLNIRLSRMQGKAVKLPVMLKRGGKFIEVKINKYFRRFAQSGTISGRTLRWYKEFGDPRFMDATTGEYKNSRSECKIVASEIWHFKHPFSNKVYGIPRWIPTLMLVMGRSAAQYVNWDLFENQGIPPLAVLVSNGVLTDESLEDLEMTFSKAKGKENWNKILILESMIEAIGLEDKGSSKLELKNLAEFRKEDQMFGEFLTAAGEGIQHRFRLPDIYLGVSSTYTHATSKVAQVIAEEQVFTPERIDEDEQINNKLVRGAFGIYSWAFQSKGPRIVGAQDLSDGVDKFGKLGAFTINHAIERANEAFGLEMSTFPEDWANYPIPIVLELAKAGSLKGIESIYDKTVANNQQLGKVPNVFPARTDKIEKSSLFSESEKKLYKMLLGINSLIQQIESCEAEPVEGE